MSQSRPRRRRANGRLLYSDKQVPYADRATESGGSGKTIVIKWRFSGPADLKGMATYGICPSASGSCMLRFDGCWSRAKRARLLGCAD